MADRLHRAAPIWAGDRAEAVGVAVMAYGTPAGPHDIERYYTDIRRGVPPSAEQLEELQRRYAAIGGGSPLLAIARAQAAGLQASLEARAPGRFLVRLGMKHSPPFIEGAIQELIAQGARRIVGLVLAPHYSALSTGEYAKRAAAAAADRAAVRLIASWHMLPAYIDALASRLCAALQTVPSSARDDLEVLFTAHSLPERILGWGDPYPRELEQTAAAVAGRVGLTRYRIAWQSAGRTAERWLGPDLLSSVSQLAAAGRRAVVVCPAGFTADHLEILYDLDIECAAVAHRLGLLWRRTESLNADPGLLGGLAELVLEEVGELKRERSLR